MSAVTARLRRQLHRWRTGTVGVGGLALLLLVTTAGALGGASLGGWTGVAVIIASLLLLLSVIALWSG